MKILYYDCFAGISGDMHLGAMLDVGIEPRYLREELGKLGISGYTLDVQSGHSKGITGTKVNVLVDDKQENRIERKLADIETLIASSHLNGNTKNLSLSIFHRLANAEARVHGSDPYNIHFHEVGAIDSLIDIIGSAICIDALKPDRVFCSPIQVGGGFVQCEHGLLPVPTPATLELLANAPIRTGKTAFETTTPTGAAILSAVVDKFADEFAFTVEKSGYGLGTRELDFPNALRICLGNQTDTQMTVEQMTMIECNIDDMNPEFYSHILDTLLCNGARDAFITPLVMKKNRPGVELSVLCTPADAGHISRILFRETTTLGTRQYTIDRTALQRETINVNTPYGTVKVKIAMLDGRPLKSKAEYEDCARIAREHNIALREVYEQVDRLLQEQIG